MTDPATGMQRKGSFPSNASYAKANTKKYKRTPIYQSSSEEGDQSSSARESESSDSDESEVSDDEHGEASQTRPSAIQQASSLPPRQKPTLAKRQAPPPASRQAASPTKRLGHTQVPHQPRSQASREVSLQAPSRLSRPASPQVPHVIAAKGPRGLGPVSRARVQQAIARKGASANRSQNLDSRAAKTGPPKTDHSLSGTGFDRVARNNATKPINIARSTGLTAQKTELASDGGLRAATRRPSSQQGTQEQTSQGMIFPQTQTFHTRTSQNILSKRPPAYEVLNASRQRQPSSPKKKVSALALAKTNTFGTNLHVGAPDNKLPKSSSFGSGDPKQTVSLSGSAKPRTSGGDRQAKSINHNLSVSTSRESSTAARRKPAGGAGGKLHSHSLFPVKSGTFLVGKHNLPQASRSMLDTRIKLANTHDVNQELLTAATPRSGASVETKEKFEAPPRAKAGKSMPRISATISRGAVEKGGPMHRPVSTKGAVTVFNKGNSTPPTARQPSVSTFGPRSFAEVAQSNPKSTSNEDKETSTPKTALADVRSAAATITPVNKLVHTKGAAMGIDAPASSPSTTRKTTVAKPKPSTLQSILADVSTVDTTANAIFADYVRSGKNLSVERGMSLKKAPEPPKRSLVSGPPNDGPALVLAKNSHCPAFSDAVLTPRNVASANQSTENNGVAVLGRSEAIDGNSGIHSAAKLPSKLGRNAQREMSENQKSSSAAKNSSKTPSPQELGRGSVPTSSVQPSASVNVQPQAISRDTPIESASAPLKAPPSVQSKASSALPNESPVAVQTEATASTQAQVSSVAPEMALSALTSSPASLEEASGANKKPILAGIAPPLSDSKPDSLTALSSISGTTIVEHLKKSRVPANVPQSLRYIRVSASGPSKESGTNIAYTIQKHKPALATLSVREGSVAATEISTKFPQEPLVESLTTRLNEVTSQTAALITPQSAAEPGSTAEGLPEIILRDAHKIGPSLEPYFQYRTKQKIWPESAAEHDAEVLDVSSSTTILETANRQAEQLFTQTKHQFISSFAVQHQQSSSAHDHEGCLELRSTLASIGWPVKKIHLKIWVERGEVTSDVAAFYQPPQGTPFLSKTLYILRLYKLTEVPKTSQDESDDEDQGEGESEEDEDKGKEEGEIEDGVSDDEESSSSDSDDFSSESDSDPDKGKHNKKRLARERLEGSPASKRRKVQSSLKPAFADRTKPTPSKHFVRQHHQISCPEVYTTLYAANIAACDLQMKMMRDNTPRDQTWHANNAAQLRKKVQDFANKEREERYWRSEFNVGLGINRFELVVEQIRVCGPRNV